jgi:hypothetical protein
MSGHVVSIYDYGPARYRTPPTEPCLVIMLPDRPAQDPQQYVFIPAQQNTADPVKSDGS